MGGVIAVEQKSSVVSVEGGNVLSGSVGRLEQLGPEQGSFLDGGTGVSDFKTLAAARSADGSAKMARVFTTASRFSPVSEKTC